MKQALLFILLFSCAFACNIGSSKTNSQVASADDISSADAIISSIPFNVDSAYNCIKAQVAFGVRSPGSPGHQSCGDWLISQMQGWGYSVQEQFFTGQDYHNKPIKGRNIIASLFPDKPKRLLLMAHWDTRAVADEDSDPKRREEAIEGADDGGSGVGVLLELARQFSLKAPNIGLDFLFFDLEDGGHSGDNDSWCLGSQYWSKNPHKANYTAQGGILLDMVGARDARFHWEAYSRSYAAPLLMELWGIAKSLGHIRYFPHSPGGTMVDDHVPVIENLGIPCVDIINYSNEGNRDGFGKHWHTHKDNMSIIDKATLQAVGETVVTYIYKL